MEIKDISFLRLAYRISTAENTPKGLPSTLYTDDEYTGMIDKYIAQQDKQEKSKSRKNAPQQPPAALKIWISDVRTPEDKKVSRRFPVTISPNL